MKQVMKKAVTVLLVSIFTSFAVYAQNENYIKKEYDVSYFNSIEVSNMLTVNIEQAAKEYVNVEFPEEILPYLVVKVRNNTLHVYIDWEKASRKIYKKYTKGEYLDDYIVNIGMMDIHGIDASGLTKVNVLNQCIVNNLEIDLSGVSTLNGHFTGTGNIEIDLSGASELDLTVNNFNDIAIDCSGAGKANINSQCDISEIDASGAAEINYILSAKSSRVEIDASGAARVEISGETQHMEVEASGAAKVNARKLVAETISMELSGAAGIDMQKDTRITYIEASGASSIRMH